LVVQSASAARIGGTFNFTATGNINAGQNTTEGQITIQGTFQASNGTFLLPFG